MTSSVTHTPVPPVGEGDGAGAGSVGAGVEGCGFGVGDGALPPPPDVGAGFPGALGCPPLGDPPEDTTWGPAPWPERPW